MINKKNKLCLININQEKKIKEIQKILNILKLLIDCNDLNQESLDKNISIPYGQ